jgi:hypothetical protein
LTCGWSRDLVVMHTTSHLVTTRAADARWAG